MATTYMGYVGVITGCKHGAFSITGDERNSGTWWKNFLSALSGSEVTFFDERRVSQFILTTGYVLLKIPVLTS